MGKLVAAVVVIFLGGCGGTGIGLNLVPEDEVRQMGLDAWREIKAETPASTDRAAQERAERVSAKVLAGAGLAPAQWEVVVFRSKEANAFALPGNKIGVYEGMMALADTDAELAAVIGHEIAHNRSGHGAERLNSEMAADLGVNLAGAVLGSASGVSPQLAAGLLGAGVQYGLLLPYSRNQELEADRLGLGYMARAGYDPHGAIALWQKMGRKGDRPPAFLSTHPHPDQRVKQLEALIPEAMATYGQAR